MMVGAVKDLTSRPDEPVPAYDAVDLTKGGDRANIYLGGQVYTLRITRSGKLILNK